MKSRLFKGLLSFFLILSISLNIFSVISFAAPAAGSEVAFEVVWRVIRRVIGGGAVGTMMSGIADEAVGAYEGLQNSIEEYNNQRFAFAQLDQPVQYFENSNNYGWVVNSDITMTPEQQEMASYMANFLNSNCPKLVLAPGRNGGLDVHCYEMLVQQASKSYLSYLKEKCAADQLEEKQFLSDLLESSEFEFSLTDHVSWLRAMADTNTSISVSTDGYKYTAPLSFCSNGYYRAAAVEALGFTPSTVALSRDLIDSGYCSGGSYTCTSAIYAANHYIIFRNQIFYHSIRTVSSKGYTSAGFSLPSFGPSPKFENLVLSSYASSDGLTLEQAGFSSMAQISQIKAGVCWAYEPVEFAYPTSVKADDLSGTATVGVDKEIGMNDDEKTISEALALGLINPGDLLTIDENGNIIAADDIAIDKLQEILDAIKDGTIEFDDIKEYMALISQLIGAGNLTADEQRRLLDNVDVNVDSIAGGVTAIRNAVDSLTDSLADEIELDDDINLDTPDNIIDKFPFCLPFDIHRLFNLLSASPQAPKITIPIKIKDIAGYSINQDFSFEIDLSDYEVVASIIRWLLYFTFIIGLVLATNKLIGRG